MKSSILKSFAFSIIAVVFSACSSPSQNNQAQSQSAPPSQLAKSSPIAVYFSPNRGTTDAIVARIATAQNTILVLAYSFTSELIATALVAAHNRGVNVQVIVDKSQPRAAGGRMHDLVAAGVPVFVDSRHAIQHNKVMVFDGKTVLTGSFNFSASAETKNAENAVFIEDVNLAKKYDDEWQIHREHSVEPSE